ncbi:hypothetical protein E2C01_088323 [Portunus trituberculatus]|uniref:Uncharacterized protein n=1 Tax=Portunus trituberculatus TaxID=210409 RepID=A0A5B7J8W8_PORTR|nr:hypothetical protein [Portunus trituberculatus]
MCSKGLTVPHTSNRSLSFPF